MSKYDDLLDDAENEAEEDIAKKLAGLEFDGAKLREAFKDHPDREKMEALIAKTEAAASAEEAKAAMMDLGLKMGKGAMKLAVKALKGGIGCLLALLIAAPAMAGLIDLDPVADWVKANSKRTRAGVSVNLNARTEAVGYIPLAWDARRGYWDLGIGFAAAKAAQVSVAPGFGINLVALGHDALKNLLGSRVGLLPLPPLWIGPVIRSPDLNDILAKWDCRERVSFYLTYGFLGGNSK